MADSTADSGRRRPSSGASSGASRTTPSVHGVPRTINDQASSIHRQEDGAPASLAVALSHDPARPDAPRVVASGKGWAAEQILTLAFEHGVKVRRDADLAQMLAALDVDAGIPLEAYTAVSEILAHVYRANQAALAAEAPPEEPPPGGPR